MGRLTFRAILGSLLLSTALIPACRSAAPPPKKATARRVVLVSHDGVGADLAWDWLANGVAAEPQGIGAMVEQGFAARRVRMVDPTLTAVNHISLATGAQPGTTGIVCNYFHLADHPIARGISGFSAPIHAETLWQAARRQGKRVGVLTWPGADGTSPERRGDFGLIWPSRPLVRSAILALDPATASHASALPSADGVKPLVWTIRLELGEAEPASVPMTLTLVDGTDDGVPAYDTVAVTRPGGEAPEILDRSGWFPAAATATAPGDDGPHRWGAWCKVLHVDRLRGLVRVYRGEVYRLLAYPDAFQDRLETAAGFWPGPPDRYGLGRWWLDPTKGIDLDTFLEQLERLDRYLDRVGAWVVENEPFDLLMAYHPNPDEYEHIGLIRDKRQWAWSPGTELAAAEGLKRVGRSFDRSVASWWKVLNPAHDALVIVSDHGLMPLFDTVNVNRVLASAGLVKIDASGRRPRAAADTPMLAYASGGCAHLYLNLKGREPGGVVERAAAPELLRRAARALADLDDDNGEPVVEAVWNRGQAAEAGLGNPDCGDLVALLEPGYTFSTSLSAKKSIEPSRYYGQHGYLNTHDELCGICFARGAGVPHERPDEIPATAVATLVSRWLGMAPPANAVPY